MASGNVSLSALGWLGVGAGAGAGGALALCAYFLWFFCQHDSHCRGLGLAVWVYRTGRVGVQRTARP
eukprot:354922-Chlamydomonas_euryale.AAC.5